MSSAGFSTLNFAVLYINYLPSVINNKSKIIIFADDTGILINNPHRINFQKDINAFEQINILFNVNLLLLNFYKTHYLQFSTRNNRVIDTNNGQKNKLIVNNTSTQFLDGYYLVMEKSCS
jgi:hypothetical protein